MRNGKLGHQGLKRLATCRPSLCSNILPLDDQRIVKPDKGGRFDEHLLGDRLAAQPLLEGVEARRPAGVTALRITAHKQLSVQDRINREDIEQFGKGDRYVVT